MHFTEVLELEEKMDQSSLSNEAVNKYIEISTHLVNMEDVAAARKLLLAIGFTKKSIEKFIKMAKDNAEMQVSEDFKLMLKGKVSKKYLN
jgi:Holliday junction resolvasome RuvABC DNA-binding subunit